MKKKVGKNKSLKPFDRYFFSIVILITIFGLFAFMSASLGVLARNESKFYGVLVSQIVFGLVGGAIGLWITSRIPYTFWRKYAFYIFTLTLILTALVFVPGLGFSHGGARRWISLKFVSFQPAELLKFGFIIYFATWLSWVNKNKENLKSKLIPLSILIIAGILILLRQPDTKSLILIFTAAFGMIFVSGLPLKKILLIISAVLLGLTILVLTRPYVKQRVLTFINPTANSKTSAYQLQQSLIAIGSGGILGRGLGQSVQKFNYLPEPQGDSVFAVIGEEFGFLGTSILVVLYVFLGIRGYKIAVSAPDNYSRYLVTGIITILIAQSFLNIASMVNLFPLTGVPLVFISQGGTSIFIALSAAGIVLNVSRFQKKV